jgi:hypothetical protein
MRRLEECGRVESEWPLVGLKKLTIEGNGEHQSFDQMANLETLSLVTESTSLLENGRLNCLSKLTSLSYVIKQGLCSFLFFLQKVV